MKRIVFYINLLIFIAFVNQVFAQRQTHVWYFGQNAGLDFRYGEPIALLDGAIDRWEGVATFSSELGELLFYTDGTTIWNKNHQVMENGEGLKGSDNSTECAIIVPHPGKENLYYVFTVDAEWGENGLKYSIVDISENDGLGKVLEDSKNIDIQFNVAEKITAVRKSDNSGFWMISRSSEDFFSVYEITQDGFLIDSRKDYYIGRHFHLDGYYGQGAIESRNVCSVGYMRISPDGKKLACANGQIYQDSNGDQLNIIELLDFNPKTGILSNKQEIRIYGGAVYGVEFSNDISYLYCSSLFSIWQIDLDDLSKLEICNHYDTKTLLGALQLSTNGKIYVAQEKDKSGYNRGNLSKYLGVINSPREKGFACDYDPYGVYLGGKDSWKGLPNFIPSYFLPPNFVISDNCDNKKVKFEIIDERRYYAQEWVISKYKGEEIFRTNEKLFYKELPAGSYKAVLTFRVGFEEFSYFNFFDVYEAPKFSLPKDTVLCQGMVYDLEVVQKENCIFELSEKEGINLQFDKPSKFVEILTDTNSFCSFSDTININFVENPKIEFNKDYYCDDEIFYLDAGLEDVKYFWNTGENTKSILIKNPGEYSLKVEDKYYCKDSLKIQINKYLSPYFSLPEDTTLCLEETIVLKPNFVNNPQEDYQFTWNDNSTLEELEVSQKGIYSLKIDGICSTQEDQIKVDYHYCGDIYIPNIITPNGDGINDYFRITGIDEVPDWQLKIFNSWGQKVFQADDYQNDFKADGLNDGVYYYLLQRDDLKFEGFFHVYRK